MSKTLVMGSVIFQASQFLVIHVGSFKAGGVATEMGRWVGKQVRQLCIITLSWG